MASLTGADMMSRARPMKAKRKKWIQKADIKEGAFTAKADAAGQSVHQYAEEKKDAPGKTGKQARLALVFEGIAKRRKSPLYDHPRSGKG